MSTTENNRRRIDRMDTWIRLAEEVPGEDKAHLRFLFYWIAYEAAYQTYETEESEGGHGKDRVRLHRKLADHDRGRLQSLLRAQKGEILRILELRQAHPSFWKRWKEDVEVETPAAWETAFEQRVRSATKRLDTVVRMNAALSSHIKEAISKTLNDLFRNLNVVRNQIVHGASAGPDSRGRTQVILGAKLLSAFIPCFRDSIVFNQNKEWGTPPFPRVGSGPDDKCPPPWLSKARLDELERRGVVAPSAPSERATPVAALGRRPGALKRFLDERNE